MAADRKPLQLKKRDCPLEIELIPAGAGWTHVYLTTGGERLFFVIVYVILDTYQIPAIIYLHIKIHRGANFGQIRS